MSIEKKTIADTELYAKVKENIALAREYTYTQNRKKDASDLCDQTIAMISGHPSFVSDAADDPEMLLHSLYKAKAAAIEFARPQSEYVEYLKKALDIAEKIVEKSGDLEWLGREYSYYGCELSNAGREEEAREFYQKAVDIAEKIGDKILLAHNLYWQATGWYNSPEKDRGLDIYKKVLQYKDDLKDNQNYVLAHGSYKALYAVKAKDKMDSLARFQSTCPGVRYAEGKASLHGEPGFSSSGGVYLNALENVILFPAKVDNLILDNNFKEGYTHEKEGFSYTFNPTKGRLEVVSMSEEVTVMSGTFADCIHTRCTTTPNDPAEDINWGAELNRKCNGTADIWFAPGVGIVKVVEKPIQGDHGCIIELAEYKISNPGETELIKKYLPLAEGNMWRYDTFDLDGIPLRDKLEYESVFEVEFASDERNLISHWGYGYEK